jgi:hypothetical protein
MPRKRVEASEDAGFSDKREPSRHGADRHRNHPSQWLNDNVWAEEDSGKWGRLREIAEVVDAKQEKMLVFTQFREMTEPLAAFLGQIFGRPGLVLHGDTAVKNRKALVQSFRTTKRPRSSCCR